MSDADTPHLPDPVNPSDPALVPPSFEPPTAEAVVEPVVEAVAEPVVEPVVGGADESGDGKVSSREAGTNPRSAMELSAV